MGKVKMLGAIVGDIIGSTYEFYNTKSMDFELFEQGCRFTVFLAKQGKSKAEIKTYVENTFGYDLNRTIAEIRPRYGFDVSCQGSVPEAIIAFLEGNSFEEVIRLAISLGGDSDTIGAMAGAIAACVYPIPEEIAERCNSILTEDLREIKDNFFEKAL